MSLNGRAQVARVPDSESAIRDQDGTGAAGTSPLALVTTFDRPEVVEPIADDEEFEGRETYQDGIEEASPFTVAEGDDDEMFVIEMSLKRGCLRCSSTFFARGKCLQCGADDPVKRMVCAS